ncbi:MAG: CsgG/HfaB family protein, partial [Synergistaceae bacterium]|nr:CsgG/HfaB family protein [Synergistaceae bacterium]
MKLWKAALWVLLLCVLLGRAEAADKIRVGVMGFQSKVDSVSDRQAEIITDVFMRGLSNSKTITIYEREQLESMVGREIRLGMSGLVDPATAVEVGKLAGIQYILTGAVTELSQKVSGATIPLFGGLGIGGGSHQAKATIDIRIIDTTTGEIKMALSETGTSTNSTTAVAFQGISYAETEFDGLQGRAISDAVTRLSYKIRSVLGGESAYVVAVGGNDYTIDMGSMLGAKEGALYLVYLEGKAIRGMSGELLGIEKLPLAVLKVNSVASGYSVATVAPPSKGTLLQRGDKIGPISASEAKKLKFMTSRP